MSDHEKLSFGQELKIKRIRLQTKRTELAKEINLSSNQIYNIESDPSMQSITRYLLFMRKKGVDLNSFFDQFIQDK